MAAQRLMRFKCLSGWLGSEEGGIDIGIGSNPWDEIKNIVCVLYLRCLNSYVEFSANIPVQI